MSGSAYNKGLPKTPEEYLDVELHPRLHKMAVNASFSKRMFFTWVEVMGPLYKVKEERTKLKPRKQKAWRIEPKLELLLKYRREHKIFEAGHL